MTDDLADENPAPAEVADVEETTSEETSSDQTFTDEVGARRGPEWAKIAGFGVLPALALVLALAAGFLKYTDHAARAGNASAIESVQAAKDGTIVILSYTPDKVEQQLTDARGLLRGDFSNQYADLINDVVIPGAKQKKISAVATVPAVGSVSAEANHAVVLLFVNQTVVVGTDAPTDTASSVRVTLDKADGKWFITAFTPV